MGLNCFSNFFGIVNLFFFMFTCWLSLLGLFLNGFRGLFLRFLFVGGLGLSYWFLYVLRNFFSLRLLFLFFNFLFFFFMFLFNLRLYFLFMLFLFVCFLFLSWFCLFFGLFMMFFRLFMMLFWLFFMSLFSSSLSNRFFLRLFYHLSMG